MENTLNRVVGRIRRVPIVARVEPALRRRLPQPVKRVLRRLRHRSVMRSPRSLLSRSITPGVENKLLSDPAVIDKLLTSERGLEIIGHHAAASGRALDLVEQVALNDPAAVTTALSELATRYGHVDAAVERLLIERPPVLSEEQIVDIYLAQDAVERAELWKNPRVLDAFIEATCDDPRFADIRDSLLDRLRGTGSAATTDHTARN